MGRCNLLIAILLYSLITVPSKGQTRGNFTYEYKLVNGKTQYEGRLEIRRNGGQWGTIHGQYWSTRQARIICKSLGFSSTALSPDTTTITFGSGIGPVHLTRVVCTGNETSIIDCERSDWDNHGQYDNHCCDVALYCLPANQSLTLRFNPLSSTSNNSGILEVYDGLSEWGYICFDYHWIIGLETDLTCRYLGFSSAVAVYSVKTADVVNHMNFLNGVRCFNDRPTYTSIDQCDFLRWGHQSTSFPDPRICLKGVSGIECSNNAVHDTFDVRLGGTESAIKGVVQVRFPDENIWRTLCFRRELYIHDAEELIAAWICSKSSGTYSLASAQFLSDCDLAEMLPRGSYKSAIARNVESLFDDNSRRTLLHVSQLVAVESTCSKLGYKSLYANCADDIEYKELQFPITEEHRCTGRCGYDPAPLPCRCDPDCVSFNDCCIDYNVTCAASNNTNPVWEYTCYTLKDGPIRTLASVMLIGNCSRDCKSESLRSRCEANLNPLKEFEDVKHSLTRWPVFDVYGNNFKNIFCALCNDISFRNVTLWNVSFIPVTLGGDGSTLPKDDDDECTTTNQSSLGQVGKRLRFCSPTMVSSCPPENNNASLTSACLEYSAQVCFESNIELVTFKNSHCAVCNGFSSTLQDFFLCPVGDFGDTRIHSGVFLKKIWNFLASESKEVSQITQCSEEYHIYDFYSQICPNMPCLFHLDSNQTQCNSPQTLKPSSIDDLCCQKQESWIIFSTDMPTYLQDEIMPCFLDLLNISREDIAKSWELNRFVGVVLGYMMIKNNDTVCSLAQNLSDIFANLSEEISECGIESVEYLYMCEYNGGYDKCDGTWYSGTAGDFLRTSIYSNSLEVYIHENKTIIPNSVYNDISYIRDEGRRSFVKDQIVHMCGEEVTLPECLLVVFYPHEFNVIPTTDNQTKFLVGEIFVEHDDYVLLSDGRLIVCAESLTNSHIVFSYHGHLDLVNSVGTCISLVANLILFISHCAYSELRNFHGKSIMSLSTGYFWALLLPMISAKVSLSRRVCVVFAIFTHYAWLATFTWMTIIGGHLCHLLIIRPNQRIVIRDASFTFRFVLPILGWCTPLIIVTLCICLHFVGTEHLFFEYGADAPCWISDSTASLVAFGAPVAVCLAVNLIFLVSIIIVYCRCCHKRRPRQRGSVRLRDVVLSLKVSVLLGMSWILGFIASAFDLPILWWIFVIINSLYGVMLLATVLISDHFINLLKCTSDTDADQHVDGVGTSQSIRMTRITKCTSDTDADQHVDGMGTSHSIRMTRITNYTSDTDSDVKADNSDVDLLNILSANYESAHRFKSLKGIL